MKLFHPQQILLSFDCKPQLMFFVPPFRTSYISFFALLKGLDQAWPNCGSLNLCMGSLSFPKNYIFGLYFLFPWKSAEIFQNGTVAASVPYSITFASRSKCHRHVDCKQIRVFRFLCCGSLQLGVLRDMRLIHRTGLATPGIDIRLSLFIAIFYRPDFLFAFSFLRRRDRRGKL